MICNARRMTQQQKTRKTFSLPRETITRASLAQTKASGDSTNEKHRSRSKSKNKVPKNVRYDLENALVSLCDVWFEEIKPYLVRNNVKVHVHGNSGVAGGDHKHIPFGAPTCSHLDPGAASDRRRPPSASYASYCSTQPTALKAQCHRPRVPRPPPPYPKISPSTQNLCRNCHEILEPKPRKQHRREQIRYSPPIPPPAIVPRLCRTSSILQIIPNKNTAKKNQVPVKGSQSKKCNLDKKCDNSLVIKPKMKNKIIQTQNKPNIDPKTEPKMKPCLKPTVDRRCPTHRCGATPLLPEQNKELLNRGVPETDSLFQKDLIDIIVEKNDKRLKVLYTSPNKEEYPSIMNLLPSPNSKQNIRLRKKPWR